NPKAINQSQTIVFGADAADHVRNGNLYAINNTFVFTHASAGFLHMLSPAPGSKAYFYNNVFHTTASGIKLAFDAASDGLMSGSNNWLTTGVTPATAFTASVSGADPGFASATDFHLAAGAAVVDKGMASPMYLDGTGASKDGTPTLQYGQLSTVGRPVSGPLDLGAYEFGTPTSTDGGLDDDGGAGSTDGGPTVGGDGGVSGGDAGAPDGDSSGGCSCDLSSPAPISSAWPLLLGGALLVLRRRRKA
ncbi:MAG: MYXO-CTERM sorting domain-containing protein, partial [Polyangiaceae bacterium]